MTAQPVSRPPARDCRAFPGPDSFRVHQRLTTRWFDNDIYGQADITICLSMFDTALTRWLIASSGLDIRTHPRIPVLAETSCRFLRGFSFPDVVSIGIGLERVGRTSVVYRLGLFRVGENGLHPEVRALGRFDVGQAAAVRDGVVGAIEAVDPKLEQAASTLGGT